MNPQSFSLIGYISVLLWFCVPLLWLLRRPLGSPGWLAPLALLLAILSYTFAKVNSTNHVNRIQAEQAEQSSDPLAAHAAKLRAVEEARGGEAADIRFAEDGSGDFLDKAGMDEADRKYLSSLDDTNEPAWKSEKKKRGTSEKDSGNIEDMLGADDTAKSMPTTTLKTQDDERPPILMSEPQMITARRLDRINLNASLIVIALGVLMIVFDYLSRANMYERAVCPLPLPASWRNSFTPLPTIVRSSQPSRRPLQAELAWLVRRGDVFICFTNDASTVPTTLPRMGKFIRPMDVVQIKGDRVSDEFIFESLWYGRSCFVVDSQQRANAMIESFLVQFESRKTARARVAKTVHLVWNLEQPLSEKNLTSFERLAQTTGFSLFLCPKSQS